MSSLMIQFLADDRLLIKGQGTVSAKGEVLEIAPGAPGAKFPYCSPQVQKDMFGHQAYVLIASTDDDGDDEDHPDLNVFLDGQSFIDPAFLQFNGYPQGIHPSMVKRGAPGYRGVTAIDEPKPTAKKKSKKTAKLKRA